MAVKMLKESFEDEASRTIREVSMLIEDLNDKRDLFYDPNGVLLEASLYDTEVFERCDSIRSYLGKIFSNIGAIEDILEKEDY